MKRIIPLLLVLLLLAACAAKPGGAAPAPTEAVERHDLPPVETTLPEVETPAEPVEETSAEPDEETSAEPDEETTAPMEDSAAGALAGISGRARRGRLRISK